MTGFFWRLPTNGGFLVPLFLTADLGEGLDIALDLAGDLVFCNFQGIARLQIHPKSGAVSEIARKAEGGIRGDTAALVDNVCDASDGDSQCQGKLVHAELQGSHKLLA